jgi:hypothetical protein
MFGKPLATAGCARRNLVSKQMCSFYIESIYIRSEHTLFRNELFTLASRNLKIIESIMQQTIMKGCLCPSLRQTQFEDCALTNQRFTDPVAGILRPESRSPFFSSLRSAQSVCSMLDR